MINYHFVFCPRYRRKLFLVDGFEARFKELVTQICEQKPRNLTIQTKAIPRRNYPSEWLASAAAI